MGRRFARLGVLGDIAIATGVASRQAKEARPPESPPKFRVLALHGLLHLLGYDHERRPGRWRGARGAAAASGRIASEVFDRADVDAAA